MLYSNSDHLLFFGSLIERLQAEIETAVTWHKSVEFRQTPDFWLRRGFGPFLGMAGQYKQLVQYGRESAHKSKVTRAQPSLRDYMFEIQHINEEENVLISGTMEKSAVGDSAEPKQQAGRLLFQSRQHFHGCWYFTSCKDFAIRLIFTRRKDFDRSKDFTIRLFFTGPKDFTIRLIFSGRKDFTIRLIFTRCRHFCIFSASVFSDYFLHFLLSMRQYLICAIISGL
jgi:hypothetical protein